MTVITRRRMVASLAAIAAASSSPLRAVKASPRLGIQLYMLGPEAFRDLPGTLAAVRSIGYTEVELPSLMGKSAEALAAMLMQAGLRCPSIHVPLRGKGFALAEPARVIDTLGALGATYAVVPMPPVVVKPMSGQSWTEALGERLRTSTADDWRRIAAELNEAASRLASTGGVVGYHNHDIELRAMSDGRTALEVLIAETDRRVVFELDVGWAMAAGADPAELLHRHAGRFALMHLKDVAAQSSGGATLTMTPAEPGQGTMRWQAVQDAMVKAGVKHGFVEQEPPFVGARIDAARRAFAFFDRRRWAA